MMNKQELRIYLKENYHYRHKLYDTNQEYRRAMKAKWNIHQDKVFNVLKKGVSFAPITDIRDFISEYICEDIEDIDPRKMQDNIRYYKQQEQLAQQLQERQAELKQLCSLYDKWKSTQAQFQLHRFVVFAAQFRQLEGQIEQIEKERDRLRRELQEEQKELDTFIVRQGELSSQLAMLQNHNTILHGERLVEQIAALDAEERTLHQSIHHLIDTIKEHAVAWERLCLALLQHEAVPQELQVSLKELLTQLAPLCRFSSENLINPPEDRWSDFCNAIEQASIELQRNAMMEQQRAEQCQREQYILAEDIARLEAGEKDYPRELMAFRRLLEQELGTSVPYLADLLEVTEEQWQPVLECFLGKRRFMLVVEPQHYSKAIALYRKYKHEMRCYGLIDVQRAQQQGEKQRMEHCLADKLSVAKPMLQDYITHILGRVICCEDEQEMRQYRVAVTKDGLLYQQFAMTNYEKRQMENLYIGQKMIKARKERLERDFQELHNCQRKARENQALYSHQPSLLWSEHFISTNMMQACEQAQRSAVIPQERALLQQEFHALQSDGLLELEEKRKKLEIEKEICNASYSNLIENRGTKKEIVRQIDFEKIPELSQALVLLEDELSEHYEEEYRIQMGLPKLEKELLRLSSPKQVIDNFRDQMR